MSLPERKLKRAYSAETLQLPTAEGSHVLTGNKTLFRNTSHVNIYNSCQVLQPPIDLVPPNRKWNWNT